MSDTSDAAYTQLGSGGRLSDVRGRLMLLARRCPYCGFGEVQDLDHFLPRSGYHRLSLYVRNLVPSCSRCNRLKGTSGASSNLQHFANPYLERFPNRVFLKAEVLMDGSSGAIAVMFSVCKPRGMSQPLYVRLSNQMKVLQLDERLAGAVNDYLGGMIVSFDMAHGAAGSAGVKQFCKDAARSNRKQFGRNHWKTALMRALALCGDFCDGGFRGALGV